MTKIKVEPYAYKLIYPTKREDYVIYTRSIDGLMTLKTLWGKKEFVFEDSKPRVVEIIAKLILEAVKMAKRKEKK